MRKALLASQGLTKRYGGLLVSDHIDFDVSAGELHALIGPNGAGKTTCLNLLSGQTKPDSGRLFYRDVDITHQPIVDRARAGIVRSYQIASILSDFTSLENVMIAVQSLSRNSYDVFRDAALDPRLFGPAHEALASVGLDDQALVLAAHLGHGGRRQLEMAMVLAMRPAVMLLDEPLAGLSGHEAKEMIALIARLKGSCSIVLVEHDMDAVFALAGRVSVLVQGKIIATGTPWEIKQNPDVHKAYLGDEEVLDGLA